MKKKTKKKLETLKEKFKNFWEEWINSKEELEFLLLQGGLTTSDLAKVFEVPRSVMYEMIKAIGIKPKRKKSTQWYKARLGKGILQSKEKLLQWISKEIENKGIVNIKMLADQLQISPEQLKSHMIRLGIDPDEFKRKPTTILVPCDYCGTLHSRSPSEVKNQKHFFCSRSCYEKWKKEQRRS